MRYEVVSKSYRHGPRDKRQTAKKGDVISLPAADGEILVGRGKLKRAAPESSTATASAPAKKDEAAK